MNKPGVKNMYRKEIKQSQLPSNLRSFVDGYINELGANTLSKEVFNRFHNAKYVFQNLARYILDVFPDPDGAQSNLLMTMYKSGLDAWENSSAENDRDRYFNFIGGMFEKMPVVVRDYAIVVEHMDKPDEVWDPFKTPLFRWWTNIDYPIVVQSRSKNEPPFLMGDYEIRLALSSHVLAYHDYKMIKEEYLAAFKGTNKSNLIDFSQANAKVT